MKKIQTILLLSFAQSIIFAQTDTLLIFKRQMFNGYNVSKQVYYFDDIFATDTVRTNIKDLLVIEFTYSAIVQGYQWERRVKGNLLSKAEKDAIKTIMREGLKLYFSDILVIDSNGKIYKLKKQTIMLKRRPYRYLNN